MKRLREKGDLSLARWLEPRENCPDTYCRCRLRTDLKLIWYSNPLCPYRRTYDKRAQSNYERS